MAEPHDIDVPSLKRRLIARRKEVEALMSAGSEDVKPVDVDQQSVGRLSRMDALQVQAMAEETARRRELELRRIEAALRRIDRDEYGYCTSCGEQVALKRLENDPATPLCIDCANRAT